MSNYRGFTDSKKMLLKADDQGYLQGDDIVNDLIPLWEKILFLIIYSILLFLVFFVTGRHYIQFLKNELRCIICVKPNMQLVTYCCFLLTIVGMTIDFLI